MNDGTETMSNLPNLGRQPYVVDLGERSYPVYVGPGIIRGAGTVFKGRLSHTDKCAIVTSDSVWETHGGGFHESLSEQAIDVVKASVPDGEEAKSWSVAEALIGYLLGQGLDRQSAIISFGGGSIGDLAGFVASIYLRGVNLIQVPTTLLSQVDSSLGGKTAVNHPKGKNLIGSFYQPVMVLSDTELLRTLPRGEILSGLGEVVKHGIIADHSLFDFVEDNVDGLVEADPGALTHVVERSVAIKGALVALDERDSLGIRAVLNYGHTAGHALETLSQLGIRHGEAVALGMMVASRLSERVGHTTRENTERQRRLLTELGFDLKPPRFTPDDIVEVMHRDKKALMGTIRFVLPTGIGSTPVLRAVSEQEVVKALEEEGYG